MTPYERSDLLRGKQHRLTVGVLVDSLEHDYQNAILRGLVQEARDHDANLLVFTGGTTHSVERIGSEIFDLVGSSIVDALVVLRIAVPHEESSEGFCSFVARFAPLPVVCVGPCPTGLPSVQVEQESGLFEAVTHLVTVHRRRRLVFISGPEGYPESLQRFDTFSRALAAADLQVDPRLVLHGDYRTPSGEAAIHELFDERRVESASVDAVVAANDLMALGAIAALERRGLRVPEHISVIGFDDIEAVRYANPPLSTVRQPLEQQGRVALRRVLSVTTSSWGSVRPEIDWLPTKFVVRSSCGCRAGSAPGGVDSEPHLSSVPGPPRFGLDAALVERRGVIVAELARAGQGALYATGAGWETRLLQAVVAEENPRATESFPAFFDEFLRKLTAVGFDFGQDAVGTRRDLAACQEVLSVLRRLVPPCAAREPERRLRIEERIDLARVMLSTAAERLEAMRRLDQQRDARAFSDAVVAVVAARDEERLGRAIERHLPGFAVGACAVTQLSDLLDEESGVHESGRPLRERKMRLLCGYDPGGRFGQLEPYPSTSLVPFPWLAERRHVSIVMPLHLDGRMLGLALIEHSSRLSVFYEPLRALLAAVLDALSRLHRYQKATENEFVLSRRVSELEAELFRREGGSPKLQDP